MLEGPAAAAAIDAPFLRVRLMLMRLSVPDFFESSSRGIWLSPSVETDLRRRLVELRLSDLLFWLCASSSARRIAYSCPWIDVIGGGGAAGLGVALTSSCCSAANLRPIEGDSVAERARGDPS